MIRDEVRARGGKAHVIKATLSRLQQLEKLSQLRVEGVVKTATDVHQQPQYFGRATVLPFRTDNVHLAVPGELTCFDAAVEYMTTLTCQELGIVPLPPSADYGLTFKHLNDRLASSLSLGKLFVLHKLPRSVKLVQDVFLETTGVFVLFCWHYHIDDIREGPSGGIPHYMSTT